MKALQYGKPPTLLGHFDFDLPEVMYYLYLPVMMGDVSPHVIRLPPNVECCRPLIMRALADGNHGDFKYAYLSARKGWATPDNPLNRPGWHCDGFGTNDLNYVWWRGPGTRFALQEFQHIPEDHLLSLVEFEQQVKPERIISYPEANLYGINPEVVHATPIVGAPGCMRQYVKVSLSNQRYNLENNSHNWLFDYVWPLHKRETIRNDPAAAQLGYVA